MEIKQHCKSFIEIVEIICFLYFEKILMIYNIRLPEYFSIKINTFKYY
jgi:hypothetical protein